MSKTEKWLRVLNTAGQGCNIVKIDWSDAYKHIAVAAEDICLQYFSWLGLTKANFIPCPGQNKD